MTGRVRGRTETEVVDGLAIADLESSAIEVRRVPIDRVVDTAPDIPVEGDVTIIPVLEEVVMVEKRLILHSCDDVSRLMQV